ncbi:uncharacterized protein BDV17DRAFT_135293 [Aspergillus undulatus]|uniref:uncharacterized protein n=1 Tax=Aspergillus undulatus TaxID=1810928 RepID=UPI003CCE2A75
MITMTQRCPSAGGSSLCIVHASSALFPPRTTSARGTTNEVRTPFDVVLLERQTASIYMQRCHSWRTSFAAQCSVDCYA